MRRDDFQQAQMIVNTSGWDTDCNAGNVGCLLGIMLGLDGLEAGPDWRGPIADRLLISSADGGNSINDAVRTAYYLDQSRPAAAGRQRARGAQGRRAVPLLAARQRAGFPAAGRHRPAAAVTRRQRRVRGLRALAIGYEALGPGQVAAVTTPTFSPREVLNMRTYDLMATPLVYPGPDGQGARRAPTATTPARSTRPAAHPRL